jgi:hypothetical protein
MIVPIFGMTQISSATSLNYFVLRSRRLSTAFWRSVVFLSTSVYTRFFFAEEALRMKSENCVDVVALLLKGDDIFTSSGSIWSQGVVDIPECLLEHGFVLN